ncbi:hypothetical protein VNO80_18084 [Phaseolus coccineus]|uniref:Uncharacterized protein n=1 Tax=Phaseolus coccineus TaxID=3886 RepID=A0AAN9MGZ3_PHACN
MHQARSSFRMVQCFGGIVVQIELSFLLYGVMRLACNRRRIRNGVEALHAIHKLIFEDSTKMLRLAVKSRHCPGFGSREIPKLLFPDRRKISQSTTHYDGECLELVANLVPSDKFLKAIEP